MFASGNRFRSKPHDRSRASVLFLRRTKGLGAEKGSAKIVVRTFYGRRVPAERARAEVTLNDGETNAAAAAGKNFYSAGRTRMFHAVSQNFGQTSLRQRGSVEVSGRGLFGHRRRHAAGLITHAKIYRTSECVARA